MYLYIRTYSKKKLKIIFKDYEQMFSNALTRLFRKNAVMPQNDPILAIQNVGTSSISFKIDNPSFMNQVRSKEEFPSSTSSMSMQERMYEDTILEKDSGLARDLSRC